ncbi:MAG: hypothetical protein WAV07_13590, partial [Candidatus Contendobacter sp.]
MLAAHPEAHRLMVGYSGGVDSHVLLHLLARQRHQWPERTLAAVDFHDTRFPAFQRWMAVNHVRMDGHLPPCLNARCRPLLQTPGVA